MEKGISATVKVRKIPVPLEQIGISVVPCSCKTNA